jgi:hypothetical protein
VPQYQVLLTSRDGTPHGQLPADGLSYEHRLGGGGSASVRCRLDHPVIADANRSNLDCWASELDVLRTGQPVFSGPVITPDGDGVAGSVGITAASAVQWLTHRYVLRDLPPGGFEQVDQTDILRALVDYAQDPAEKGPHADCRLLVDAPPTGVLRDRSYLGAERGQIAALVQQLADVQDGVDLTVRYALVGTVVQRLLSAHYPLAGVDVDTPLTLGRNLTSLTVKHPGEQLATRVLAVGNGEGSDQITATAVAPDGIEQRYGVHELPLSVSDVKEQPTLQAHADGMLAVHSPPLVVVGATYRVGPAAPYDLCDLGDRVRVQADRGWLQLDERLRVVARKVTVAASGTETIDLTFNSALEAG